MKKFFVTMTITMLVIYLPAEQTFTLTSPTLVNGHLQILGVGSGFSPARSYTCVLLSTTDFINWTPVRTNQWSMGLTVTNTIQITNTLAFYKARVF